MLKGFEYHLYRTLMENTKAMTTKSQNWAQAFRAFLDRRALVMFCLGFSAGIPILLIFSSLSLWLGEAGIEKSAVTFFSWAALGYSFKFVWAPLVDELPIPFLTQKMGRRRSWLFFAQIMIIVSIITMALADPASGELVQMAVGAVLLGFFAATQDIVIDAYRIELADTNMQTVLASTYNAGYRLGMIVAGAGALFLASFLGTEKGNYIYSAWQYTYLLMAVVMLVGVATTCLIQEPLTNRKLHHYQRQDYFRLVGIFFITVLCFVLTYIFTNPITHLFSTQDNFLLFCIEAVRFLSSGVMAVIVGIALVKFGFVNREMAIETWVRPIQDFFQRYGLKLALFLLLLIGFYRISDILAGVISNVFYQDLNFTKDQIATAVKIYGVVFSLLGGFVGGLLAQRFNIMKLMFVGAILASATNLVFIGLVKSGVALQPVTVLVGQKTFTTMPDDVGYFSINLPINDLKNMSEVQVQTENTRQEIPIVHQADRYKVQISPITVMDGKTEKVFVKGQVFDETVSLLRPNNPIEIKISGQRKFVSLDKNGHFTALLKPELFKNNHSFDVLIYQMNNQILLTQTKHYDMIASESRTLEIEPLPLVQKDNVILKGKVIKSYSTNWLHFTIFIDNIASGLAGAAFIAFLSSLTSVSFTAVQYAIFSSLMTLTPKILGGYSGMIVTNLGYPKFFLMTTLLGIPILILIIFVARLLNQHQEGEK